MHKTYYCITDYFSYFHRNSILDLPVSLWPIALQQSNYHQVTSSYSQARASVIFNTAVVLESCYSFIFSCLASLCSTGLTHFQNIFVCFLCIIQMILSFAYLYTLVVRIFLHGTSCWFLPCIRIWGGFGGCVWGVFFGLFFFPCSRHETSFPLIKHWNGSKCFFFRFKTKQNKPPKYFKRF